MAPRPPSALDRLQAENDRLRHRVAELEAEIDRFRPKPVRVKVVTRPEVVTRAFAVVTRAFAVVTPPEVVTHRDGER
jgi:hypothetical protein